MNPTIEATARARGMTVDALFREASLRALQHMSPKARAAMLDREARRAGAVKPVKETRAPAALIAIANKTAAADEEELAASFKRLGLNDSAAKVAARGRGSVRESRSLIGAMKRLGLSERGAHVAAAGRHRICEAVTKTEPAVGDFKGGAFEKGDYAYAPSDDPSTWVLLLTLKPGGALDPDSIRAAVNAIDGSNPTPCPVPTEALPDVKATLTKAWTAAGLGDLPAILTAESLRAAFRRLGVTTSTSLNAAVRGRAGRS